MKVLYLLSFILFLSASAVAQSPLSQGETQANFGLGIDDVDGVPIYAGVDFGIADNITLGPVASISGEYFSATGALNYHFNQLLSLPSDINVYAGINAGFFIDTNDNDDGDDDNEGFGLGVQLGGRYFFNDRWAINLEAAGGNQVSGGKLGATYLF